MRRWIASYQNEWNEQWDIVFSAESFDAARKEAYSHEQEYGLLFSLKLEQTK